MEEETEEEAKQPLNMAERAALAGWIYTFKQKYEVNLFCLKIVDYCCDMLTIFCLSTRLSENWKTLIQSQHQCEKKTVIYL